MIPTSEKVTFRNGNEGVSTDERYSGWSPLFITCKDTYGKVKNHKK